MIELQSVKKAFNQGKPNEFWAINGVSLTLEAGQITCLTGPSGSGKTSLLAIIGCLSRPTSGRVTLHGKPLSGLPERFLANIRQQTFGFIFQQFHLIRGLTVLENVLLPALPRGLPYHQLRQSAETLLDNLSLADKMHTKSQWLSGGEAQRVAICRALINEPDILIADEPTANLDTALIDDFLEILTQLQQQGKTLLLSSHDKNIFESPMVNRVIKLRDGVIDAT